MNGQLETGLIGKEPGTIRVAVTNVKIRMRTLEANLAEWLKAVDKAGLAHPDVIVLSETVYERGCGLKGEKLGEPVPGRLVNTMAEKARRYAAYIAFSMYERTGPGSVYNTAVLLDRNGRIAGLHRKTFLANDEKQKGILAGSEFRVFDTEIGKVGLMVCRELSDPEIPRKLKRLGAKIILAPTIGNYSVLYPAIAKDNGIWLAVSGQDCAADGSYPSILINPQGEAVCSVVDESCITNEYCGSGGTVAWADIPFSGGG